MGIRAFCCFPGLCSSHSILKSRIDSDISLEAGLSSWYCSQVFTSDTASSCTTVEAGGLREVGECLTLACGNIGALLQT